MTHPESYSFRRYLDAKRTVDQRAYNRRVREQFLGRVRDQEPPYRILEVGAGTGAMLEHYLGWDGTPRHTTYTAIDSNPELLAVARTRIIKRASNLGYTVSKGDTVVLDRDTDTLTIEFISTDAYDYLRSTSREWDTIIAHAFLDLTDVRAALRAFTRVLAAGGDGYFPITFDGATIFLPTIDPELDTQIPRRYHHHMDSGGGDPHAGRRVINAIQEHGGEVIGAGGSDWIVTPSPAGYPAEEEYFLHYIIWTVRQALVEDPAIPLGDLADWVATRHHQIETHDLVYIAHNLDIYGSFPARIE